MLSRKIRIVSLVLLGSGASAQATDINAASCSQADVQAAINLAANFDRVFVPAGQCTWTARVILNAGRNIVLQGAGMDFTIITVSNVATNGIDLSTTGSRVTGFGFIVENSDQIVRARGQNWRVDHNRFTSPTFKIGVFVSILTSPVHPTGVVDHNEFINTRVMVFGSDGTPNGSRALWFSPSTIGNANQTGVVYVEDNSFTFTVFGNCIDSEIDSRYVFRNNTALSCNAEAHSNQGARNSKSWEIYNNTFLDNRNFAVAILVRGGTGVVFNNTIAATFNRGMAMDNVRSFSPRPDLCNGQSSQDGNDPTVGNGWPCRDQIGRGSDSVLATSVQPSPPQLSEPAHFWNNTKAGVPTSPVVQNNTGPWIQQDRDYFLSPRPNYTPFTYPHPLVTRSWFRPDPPTNLRTP